MPAKPQDLRTLAQPLMQSAGSGGWEGVESVFLSWGKKLMSDPPQNHPPPHQILL